ncbi:MAG TPA: outer membrane beta-barrel protein [Treponemataceae bacterium]|nr:outer membrane beta-barrel protein [Treponemataceae bacterium]
MKKSLFCVLFVLIVSVGAYAQLSAGVSSGVTFSFEDSSALKGYSERKAGFPFLAQVGYTLPVAFDVPTGSTHIIVGGRFGYENLWAFKNDAENTKVGLWTLPLNVFGRLESGFFYVDIGLGIHIWFLPYLDNGIDVGENGVGFSSKVSSGVKYTLREKIDLHGGLVFNTFRLIKTYTNTMGINIGVVYTF